MSEIKKPKCGFACLKTYEGQKDFDTDYINIELKKVVRKVGPGDEDYIVEDKEIITKRPIAETIAACAADAGIENYLKPYIQAGADLPNVNVSDEVQDFSNFPETMADAAEFGKAAQAAFDALPIELRGKSKNVDEFIRQFSKEKFDEYIQSKVNALKQKEKEVKEIENE